MCTCSFRPGHSTRPERKPATAAHIIRLISVYSPSVLTMTVTSAFPRFRQNQPCLPSNPASRTPSAAGTAWGPRWKDRSGLRKVRQRALSARRGYPHSAINIVMRPARAYLSQIDTFGLMARSRAFLSVFLHEFSPSLQEYRWFRSAMVRTEARAAKDKDTCRQVQ